jgi:integrase/recombinase XerD
MKDKSLLGPWVRRFLLEHLVAERNLSRNTQASYRDTLTLLLPFASKQAGCAIDRITVEELTPEVVRKFLDHLEQDRQCSEVTRNQRLATIHSLARFIGTRSPLHLAWCSEIRGVPFKKTTKTGIGYLEKDEMDALLNQADRRTSLGVRDHALLLFLYNSGARADEAAKLTVGNLQLGASPSVRLHGKGNKIRICPLWPTTTTALTHLVAERNKNEAVFLGRTNQPLTRFGIHRLVTQYAAVASETMPALAKKRVSPHTIRHTTAVHLLRAGVDINTIRAWLGHVSLDTTHIYAEVDLKMKADALAQLSQLDEKSQCYQWGHGESFHYTTLAGARAVLAGTVMRGGGWGGRSSLSCLTNSLCSALISVVRLMTKMRPSVVGKCTSSICTAANLSSTALGVRPEASGLSRARSVTCRQ